MKDFAYYLKEQFKKDRGLSIDFILNTLSSIFFILNEFRYEEDKRLLGYVLVHEFYKDKVKKTFYTEQPVQKSESISSNNPVMSDKSEKISEKKSENFITEQQKNDI